ncbi:MAG: transposase [Bryobacteraceae bacterium]|nr:transposase [Bryobacteraceae bacterium]
MVKASLSECEGNRATVPRIPRESQRGNYRQKIFFRAEDYRLYLNLLADYARHYGVAILGYCLMPNHVHLILVPRGRGGPDCPRTRCLWREGF